MRAAYIVLIAVIVGSPMAAQQEASRPARRLSFSATMGGMLGGPARGVVGQLPGLGYGDTSPGGCFFIFCSGTTDYPEFSGGVGANLSARYELGDRWAVSATWAKLSFGTATGYRAGLGEFVYSTWSARVLSAAGHFDLIDGFSVGGGLSVNGFNGGERTETHLTRVGLTGEADLRLPRSSRVFWELALRGHWLPGSEEMPIAPYSSLRLRPRWSYTTLSTGIGIRL